jgi:subtilisin family serine protease
MHVPFRVAYGADKEAVRDAVTKGKVVVVSAGHQANELTVEEEDDTGSIIVGALMKSGATAGFSNYGERVSVAAYAEKIWTLQGPNGRMDYIGGAPAAASQVAGTIALMLAVNPYLRPLDVRYLLETTRLVDITCSNVGGRLDTFEAVSAAIRY